MSSNPEYRRWLLDKLVHRDPEVTRDFRERRHTEKVAPKQFGELPYIDTIVELYNNIMCHNGDYDAGLLEISRKEGFLSVPANDGITHINIYSKGKTKLGRGLSNFAAIKFEHPIDGECASVEGYWYYLRTGRKYPYLKSLTGKQAKDEGKKYEREDLIDFQEYIKQAITCKIMQNEQLKEDLKNSTLPFCHYYYFGSESKPKVYPMENRDAWIIYHIEDLRKDLQRSH